MNVIHDEVLVALNLTLCPTSKHATRELGRDAQVTCKKCISINQLLESSKTNAT